jgi:predicted ATPase
MHLFLGSKEISEANAKIAKKVCSLPDKDFFIVKDNPNGVKGIRYEVASKILSSLLSKVDNADFAAIPPVVLAQLGYLIPDIQLLHLQYPVFQGSADLEKIRIFSAFEILLKTLSEQKPIFVFVCNMQFVDSVSLELISYLIRRGPKKNLLQVFTYDREMVGDELLQFLQSIAKVDNCLVKNI